MKFLPLIILIISCNINPEKQKHNKFFSDSVNETQMYRVLIGEPDGRPHNKLYTYYLDTGGYIMIITASNDTLRIDSRWPVNAPHQP